MDNITKISTTGEQPLLGAGGNNRPATPLRGVAERRSPRLAAYVVGLVAGVLVLHVVAAVATFITYGSLWLLLWSARGIDGLW